MAPLREVAPPSAQPGPPRRARAPAIYALPGHHVTGARAPCGALGPRPRPRMLLPRPPTWRPAPNALQSAPTAEDGSRICKLLSRRDKDFTLLPRPAPREGRTLLRERPGAVARKEALQAKANIFINTQYITQLPRLFLFCFGCDFTRGSVIGSVN